MRGGEGRVGLRDAPPHPARLRVRAQRLFALAQIELDRPEVIAGPGELGAVPGVELGVEEGDTEQGECLLAELQRVARALQRPMERGQLVQRDAEGESRAGVGGEVARQALGDFARLQECTQRLVVLSGAPVPGGEGLVRLGQLEPGSGAR